MVTKKNVIFTLVKMLIKIYSLLQYSPLQMFPLLKTTIHHVYN